MKYQHTNTHTHTHTHTHVYYIYIYIDLYIDLYIYTHLHILIHIIFIYTHIYIYIHLYIKLLLHYCGLVRVGFSADSVRCIYGKESMLRWNLSTQKYVASLHVSIRIPTKYIAYIVCYIRHNIVIVLYWSYIYFSLLTHAQLVFLFKFILYFISFKQSRIRKL